MDHDIDTKGIKQDFNEKDAKAPDNPLGSSPPNSAGASGLRTGEEDVNRGDGTVKETGDPITFGQKGVKP